MWKNWRNAFRIPHSKLIGRKAPVWRVGEVGFGSPHLDPQEAPEQNVGHSSLIRLIHSLFTSFHFCIWKPWFVLLNLFNLKQTIQSFTASTSFPLKWNQGWFLGMFALGCISSTQPSAFDTLRYAQTWRVSPRQPEWRDGERIQKQWKQTWSYRDTQWYFHLISPMGFPPKNMTFPSEIQMDPDGSLGLRLMVATCWALPVTGLGEYMIYVDLDVKSTYHSCICINKTWIIL